MKIKYKKKKKTGAAEKQELNLYQPVYHIFPKEVKKEKPQQ
jgi:hypothetical protein